jgi:hypothetical protein
MLVPVIFKPSHIEETWICFQVSLIINNITNNILTNISFHVFLVDSIGYIVKNGTSILKISKF